MINGLDVHRYFYRGSSVWPGPWLDQRRRRQDHRQYHRLNFDTLHASGIIVFRWLSSVARFDSRRSGGGDHYGLIQQFASGYLDGKWGLNGTEIMPHVCWSFSF
jgi:hypothetical protein